MYYWFPCFPSPLTKGDTGWYPHLAMINVGMGWFPFSVDKGGMVRFVCFPSPLRYAGLDE